MFHGTQGAATLRIFRWLLAYKAAYALLVAVCLAVFPRFENGHYDNCLHYLREGPPTLASQLATWDAAHYLLLAETGYQRGSPSCAFYPLWPALMRAGSYVTGGNVRFGRFHFGESVFTAGGTSIVVCRQGGAVMRVV